MWKIETPIDDMDYSNYLYITPYKWDKCFIQIKQESEGIIIDVFHEATGELIATMPVWGIDIDEFEEE